MMRIISTSMLALALLSAPQSWAAGYHGTHGKKAFKRNAAQAQAAPENHYELQRLPAPDDAVFALAVDVNNRGTVGGVMARADGGQETLLWSSTGLRRIQHPGEMFTSVPSINDGEKVIFGNWGSLTGQTAGTYNLRTGAWNALPAIPGKPINIGWSFNNAGTAVGQACEGTFFEPVHCLAWIWDGKDYEFITIPNATDPVPVGINERGQIVGYYLVTPPFGFRSFLYHRGQTTMLLPDTDCNAYTINNQGEITLMLELAEGELFQPAILDGEDLMLTPLWPGAFGTSWLGLSERGDLAGLAYDGPTDPPYPMVARRK